MAQIIINGKPFEYESINLEKEEPKCLDKNIARENLLIYKKILDNCGVKFLLMHGTLLGAIRNHDFIDWDCDIDTYVYDEEALKAAIPQLYEAGLKLCRVSKIEYSFIRNGIYIDAFLSQRHPNIFLRPFFCIYQFGYFPKKFFKRSKKIDFLDTQFDVPEKPEKILTYFYGNDWMVPKKDASSMNSTSKLASNNIILTIVYKIYGFIKKCFTYKRG